MMTANAKRCKDCECFRPGNPSLCASPENKKPDEPTKLIRRDPDMCGPEAKWFEAKIEAS